MPLYDTEDPTTALFMSMKGAETAAHQVATQHPERVSRAVPKRRHRRGELIGYQVITHFRNGDSPCPITNGDFERLNASVH